jgi:hypothetical protein
MISTLALLLITQVTSITPTRTGTEAFWDNAMRRAFTDAGQNCINDSVRRSGCRIRLPCNTTMQFGSTLHISRSHIIEGCGPESTILQFPYHVTGVRFHNATGGGNSFSSTSPWDSIGGPASFGSMRDLQIQGNNHRTVTATVGHGIVIEAPYITLDNVRVDRVRGHGIRISADVNRSPPTNANHVRLEHVRVQNSYWSGLYVNGGDTNASGYWMLDASANCVSPNFLPTNPAVCAGIVDVGFLGSTYVAPHVASNGGGRGYYFDGGNQRMTIVGSYAETDNLTHVMGREVMTSVGGNTPWINIDSGGMTMIGAVVNKLRVRNDYDPNNLVEFCLGECENLGGHIWSARSYLNNFANSPRRYSFESILGLDGADWFAQRVDFLNAARSIYIGQTPGGPIARGQLWIQQPMLVGASASRVPLRAAASGELFANNAFSTLRSNIGAAATSIPLATGTGARFPSPTGGQFFYLTLESGSVIEILRCTSRTADDLICTRGSQGTTARIWNSGTTVEHRLTAQSLVDLQDVR